MKILSLVLGLLVSVHAGQGTMHFCEGFAPQNNRKIPVAPKGFLQAGGITEQEFNDTLSRLENIMAGDVTERGAVLKVNRHWESSEVNAYADRDGNDWLIEMHGGLARHELMTPDGYILVACHELGHHIGGAPHSSWFDDMSNEGQADYYATLKCFRRLFTLEENQAWAASNTVVNPFIDKECAARYPNDEAMFLSCKRGALAGLVLGNVLADLGMEAPPTPGQFDQSVVAVTDDAHPAAQCRLDTYYNGSVCDKTVAEKVSDTDHRVGACEKADGYAYGFRPRCWYAPEIPDVTQTFAKY
jgi:hypothetical protein